MYIRALYAFHFVYFIVFASMTFLPKYLGELGMRDGQIGVLLAVPAIAGVIFQPLFGILTDRVRVKKTVLIVLLAALAVVCFVLDGVTRFGGLLIGLTLFTVLQLPIAPAYSTISLEYTHQIGKPYGPIRLMGTVGYQLGALLIGIILAGSLRGLYRVLGCVIVAACAAGCFLPPIAGHQHGRSKISITALLRDRHVRALLAMVLIGTITTQFYTSFYSKHLGDLGISNTVTGIMVLSAVLLELPFLIFSDRLARRTNIWNWLLIGLGLNAVRWIGLSLSRSVPLLMLFDLTSVSVMACFEFFPALYLNEHVPDALKGSAQTALMLIAFGIAKIIASLLGGFISDRIGIPAVFLANGVLLCVALIAFWRPTRRLIAAERDADA